MLRRLLPTGFDGRLFGWLCLGFILFTVIGTLSHEGGHYIVARAFGHHPRIGYAFTSLNDPDTAIGDFLNQTSLQYREEIMHHRPFPESERYYRLSAAESREYVWFTMGGPLQTMITGTIGCLAIAVRRKRYYERGKLLAGQWLTIFFAFFWLRQLANGIVWLANWAITHKWSHRGDEYTLARYWHLPFGSVIVVTGLFALAIGVIITFRIIPAAQRRTFIAAGMVGGVAGYLLWLEWVGPVLMP